MTTLNKILNLRLPVYYTYSQRSEKGDERACVYVKVQGEEREVRINNLGWHFGKRQSPRLDRAREQQPWQTVHHCIASHQSRQEWGKGKKRKEEACLLCAKAQIFSPCRRSRLSLAFQLPCKRLSCTSKFFEKLRSDFSSTSIPYRLKPSGELRKVVLVKYFDIEVQIQSLMPRNLF